MELDLESAAAQLQHFEYILCAKKQKQRALCCRPTSHDAEATGQLPQLKALELQLRKFQSCEIRSIATYGRSIEAGNRSRPGPVEVCAQYAAFTNIEKPSEGVDATDLPRAMITKKKEGRPTTSGGASAVVADSRRHTKVMQVILTSVCLLCVIVMRHDDDSHWNEMSGQFQSNGVRIAASNCSLQSRSY
jgi:hypothetical protein